MTASKDLYMVFGEGWGGEIEGLFLLVLLDVLVVLRSLQSSIANAIKYSY